MTAELETLQSPRYLVGTKGDLELTIYRDGTATDPSSVGTVVVADEDGNTLSTGAASIVGSNTGLVRYTPTAAAMAEVKRLVITWPSVVIAAEPAITLTTYCEVVGDMLFNEAQARAYDNAALAVANGYSDDDIRNGHDRVMDAFEHILKYPLGRRYFRETVDGTGRSKLRLETRRIQSITAISSRTPGTQTWTAFTEAQLVDVVAKRWGLLERETMGNWTEGVQNYRISGEAGRPIPAELRTAALRVLRHQLVPSNLPDRALFQTNEIGQFRLAVAGDNGHWFGIPDVDAVLMRLRDTVVY